MLCLLSPLQDADDTAAAVDIPEASAHDAAHMSDDGADAGLAAQEPKGTPAPRASATAGGLTPVLGTDGPTPGATEQQASMQTDGPAATTANGLDFAASSTASTVHFLAATWMAHANQSVSLGLLCM